MHATRSSAWPLFSILACVLVAAAAVFNFQFSRSLPSVTAPPATVSVPTVFEAARQPSDHEKSSPASRRLPDVAPEKDTVSEEEEAPSRSRSDRSGTAPGDPRIGETEWKASGSEEPASVLPQVPAFSELVRPRRDVGPTPPVADRIDLARSLAELPRLADHDPGVIANRAPEGSGSPAAVSEPRLAAVPNLLGRSYRATGLARSWPYPASLLRLLSSLTAAPTASLWSRRVRGLLERLHHVDGLGHAEAGTLLVALQQKAYEGKALSNSLADLHQRARVMRAVYALQRRLAIWRPVHQLARPTTSQLSVRNDSAGDFQAKLKTATARLSQLSNPEKWRRYLLLDRLRELSGPHQFAASSFERSRVAQEFLRRWDAADTTPEQADFFSHLDWQDLVRHVRQWVCEPVHYASLLDALEQLESARTESFARKVANQYEILRWSAYPEVADLGDRLNIYYRNANVRVAIAGDLLNRLLPHHQVMDEPVNDPFLGSRILGRSRVSTRLRLVLVPDRERWRLGLEALGDVDSSTRVRRGPALFHSDGRARYLARKLLLIDRRGVHAEGAEAAASSDADLRRIETDLDGVPLVNLLARTIAKQMYDSQLDRARNEAEGLLVNRAASRLDQEVNQQLSSATNHFRRHVWEPLQGLGLRPEAVDMETTQKRLIARYRLASCEQVAAFTPRPQAPADSMLSMQVHQSALNNVIANLELGGREVGLRELFHEVAAKLQREDFRVPEDVPKDVRIEFAVERPVSFRFHEDRIHLTLRIKKLRSGDGHRWDDFQVRGIYVPKIEGVHVGIERDSYIRLKGNSRRLPLRDQIALRGIFARVIAQHPEVDLLANVLRRDERLSRLSISQFVARDGWVGIAVSPGPPARARIADQPRSATAR